MIYEYIYDITYSGKFSRRIIFAVFADWIQPRKFKVREILEYLIGAALLYIAESVVRENSFREIFENTNPRKLCASIIWRYNYGIFIFMISHYTPSVKQVIFTCFGVRFELYRIIIIITLISKG